MAERFRDAGYATFFAGKWHLGGGAFSPNAQGFGPGLIESENTKKSGQFWYPDTGEPAPDFRNDPKTTDRIADDAVRFIENHTSQPFFAYLPFLAVHVPIGARADLVAKYKKKKATAPPDAWGREGDSDVRLVQNEPVYAAMIEQLDSAIWRVLAALERNGLAEKTVVVFMSDNGGLATAEGHPTSNLPLRGGRVGLTKAAFASLGSSVLQASPNPAALATRRSSARIFIRRYWSWQVCGSTRSSTWMA